MEERRLLLAVALSLLVLTAYQLLFPQAPPRPRPTPAPVATASGPEPAAQPAATAARPPVAEPAETPAIADPEERRIEVETEDLSIALPMCGSTTRNNLDEHYWGQLAGLPSTQGYGHSTVTMACEVPPQLLGQLILFHHDPAYSDNMLTGMEQTAKSLFSNAVTAYEGLEIALQLQKPSTLPLHPREMGTEAVQYVRND